MANPQTAAERGQVPSVTMTEGHSLCLEGLTETSRRGCVCLAAQLRQEATCRQGLDSAYVGTGLLGRMGMNERAGTQWSLAD